MQIQHRRQSALNNRITAIFSLLSAASRRPLILVSGFVLAQGVLANTISDDLSYPMSQLNHFLAGELANQFPDFDAEDKHAEVRTAINQQFHSTECLTDWQIRWRQPPGAGLNTLAVSCDQPLFQMYLSVRIDLYRQVAVAARALDRDTPLSKADIDYRRMNLADLRSGYFSVDEQLDGYRTRRTLKPSTLLTPYVLTAPELVSRGDWVTLIAGNDRVRITAKAEALDSGQAGDQIRVRNLASQQVVRAWILEKGVVSTQP